MNTKTTLLVLFSIMLNAEETPFSNNEAYAYKTNENYKVKVDSKTALLFSSIYKDKVPLDSKKFNDILFIDGCNTYDWCKIKNKEEYIAKFRLRMIAPLPFKPLPKKVIKIIPKANIETLKKMNYHQLQEVYASNMEDENINLYLGLNELKDKEYDKTIASFERVLIYNENSSEAKLAMADAYFNQGSYTYSEAILLNLKKDNKISKITLNQTNKRLGDIDDKKQKHFLNSIVILGTEYDNNIFNTKDARKSDSAYQVVALLNHRYLISNTMSFKNSLMVFQKDYMNTKDRKTKLISFTPSISALSKNYILDFSLYFDSIYFSSNYNVNSYGLASKFKYRYSNALDIAANAKYITKEDQLDSKLDSTVSDILLGLNINKIPKVPGKLKLLATYTKESSDVESLKKTSLKANINYAFKVKDNITTLFDYINKVTDYTQRTDTQNTFSISTTFNVPDIVILQVKANHTKNDSSQEESKYKKTTYGLNLIKTF